MRRCGDRETFGSSIWSVKAVLDVPSGVRPRTCWAGTLIKASNGLARGCVGVGWARKQVAALLRVSGDLWDGPGSEAIRD